MTDDQCTWVQSMPISSIYYVFSDLVASRCCTQDLFYFYNIRTYYDSNGTRKHAKFLL